MFPSFSVIAPIYGVENYILKFAETLLGQTYDDVQFIFVNDGTKDSSMELLGSLIDEKYPHLKEKIVIVDKQNGGLPAARKSGVEVAQGDYILHVDSDDWLEVTLLEDLATEIRRTDSDIVYYDFFKEYSSRTKKDVENDYDASSKMEFIHGLFNYKAYGYVWNKCIRRKLYVENEIYFPPYGMHEDIYLMSQLIFHAESLSHLKKALYHYRRGNPGSISSACRRSRRQDSAMNMMSLYEHFMEDTENSPVRDVTGEIFFRTAWLSIRYGFGFFDRYPYLVSEIRKRKPSFRNKTFFLWQLIVKFYCLCRR